MEHHVTFIESGQKCPPPAPLEAENGQKVHFAILKRPLKYLGVEIEMKNKMKWGGGDK